MGPKQWMPIDGGKLRGILAERGIGMKQVSVACGQSETQCAKWTRMGEVPPFVPKVLKLDYGIEPEAYASDVPIGAPQTGNRRYQRTEISDAEYWERMHSVMKGAFSEALSEGAGALAEAFAPIIRSEVYRAVNEAWGGSSTAIAKNPSGGGNVRSIRGGVAPAGSGDGRQGATQG